MKKLLFLAIFANSFALMAKNSTASTESSYLNIDLNIEESSYLNIENLPGEALNDFLLFFDSDCQTQINEKLLKFAGKDKITPEVVADQKAIASTFEWIFNVNTKDKDPILNTKDKKDKACGFLNTKDKKDKACGWLCVASKYSPSSNGEALDPAGQGITTGTWDENTKKCHCVTKNTYSLFSAKKPENNIITKMKKL